MRILRTCGICGAESQELPVDGEMKLEGAGANGSQYRSLGVPRLDGFLERLAQMTDEQKAQGETKWKSSAKYASGILGVSGGFDHNNRYRPALQAGLKPWHHHRVARWFTTRKAGRSRACWVC